MGNGLGNRIAPSTSGDFEPCFLDGSVPRIQYRNMAERSHPESDRIRLRNVLLKGHPILWTAGAIFLAALVTVILWKVPQLQVQKYANATPPMEAKDQFSGENAARQTLATILGGIVVLAGAYFTWRNIKLLQEGQITERFTKAIEQLGAVDSGGKKKLEVRLGGIYALERIAKDSQRDYWPIMEVLCTYVRENAPHNLRRDSIVGSPAHDIQAIITVLGRRNYRI